MYEHACIIYGMHFCLFTPCLYMATVLYTHLSQCILCIGHQSQSEAEGNDTNILMRSLPSDDDNDNLPLVLQTEESVKVKAEWSSLVGNGQLNEESKL